MSARHIVIAIDGPAGSGKSTIARLLADALGMTFLDTGAMYRAVTLAAMQARIDLTDPRALARLMDGHSFGFEPHPDGMAVTIDSRDVTNQIRDAEVTANARYIAAAEPVRRRLVEMQRRFAAEHQAIVTEGRDQATVAFPDADVKIYLTASPEQRAERRAAELRSRGLTVDLDDLQKAIVQRDESDMNRSVGPLKTADDAITVDTTDLSIRQVVDRITALVREQCR